MTEDELREILQMLEEAGVQAQLCDTPVGVSISSARCGIPTELGDDGLEDYILLPKAVVGIHPEMFIPATGDSMRDAGYDDGDMLRVRFGVEVNDGDDALALIDGTCTVKTLFTDETGQAWLVPQNEKYDAIMLTEDMDIRLLGRVIGVQKQSSRPSSRDMLQAIRRTKNKLRAAGKMSDEQVDALIVRIGTRVLHARQWYAVMRALADVEVIDASDFEGFCNRVSRLLPDHKHLPEPKELSRIAVMSFSKPVAMWTEDNAPVSGKRFRDYLDIALKMVEFLREEMKM